MEEKYDSLIPCERWFICQLIRFEKQFLDYFLGFCFCLDMNLLGQSESYFKHFFRRALFCSRTNMTLITSRKPACGDAEHQKLVLWARLAEETIRMIRMIRMNQKIVIMILLSPCLVGLDRDNQLPSLQKAKN